MRLPVPAFLTSNHFLSLPGKSASNKKKERKKERKNKSQFEQILLLPTMKANNTMLEVDDVSCYQQAGYQIGSSRD